MAGRPRTRGRAPRPLQRVKSTAARRDRLTMAWGQARTPIQRLQAAYQVLSGLAAAHQPNPTVTDQQIERAAAAVHNAVTAILADHDTAARRRR